MQTAHARPGYEALWITLALLALVLAWDTSGFDLPLARLAGSEHGFPWRDQWLLTGVLHDGARRLAWLVALVLCLAVWWPVGAFERLTTSQRLQLAVTVLLAPLAVSLLKSGSQTSCPWDLSTFGGFAAYTSHWSLQPDGGGGHCFPAGHASSGFALMGGYFAVRATSLPAARRWLAAGAGSGMVLGLGQQWRGAHFMSHTLWSALVCWCVAWAIDAAWPRASAVLGAVE
jgi:membrane-associated PAP2 superfamily phosphatase